MVYHTIEKKSFHQWPIVQNGKDISNWDVYRPIKNTYHLASTALSIIIGL